MYLSLLYSLTSAQWLKKLNWVLDVLLQRHLRLQLFQILQHFNKNMHLFLFLVHPHL